MLSPVRGGLPPREPDAVLLEETTQASRLGTTLPSGQARMPGGGGGNGTSHFPPDNCQIILSLGTELTFGFSHVASLSLSFLTCKMAPTYFRVVLRASQREKSCDVQHKVMSVGILPPNRERKAHVCAGEGRERIQTRSLVNPSPDPCLQERLPLLLVRSSPPPSLILFLPSLLPRPASAWQPSGTSQPQPHGARPPRPELLKQTCFLPCPFTQLGLRNVQRDAPLPPPSPPTLLDPPSQ